MKKLDKDTAWPPLGVKDLGASEAVAAPDKINQPFQGLGKKKLWLVQLLHPDGPMGSFLCTEDPRKSLARFKETYGKRLEDRNYYVDVVEVDTFDAPIALTNKLTQLVDEIAKESNWKDWPPK